MGASVHAPTVGVSDDVIGTIMVHVAVAAIVLVVFATVITLVPAVAVTDAGSPTQVPETTLGVAMRKPAGRVSTKLNATDGFVAIWVTVKVKLVDPPNTRSPAKTLFTVGTLGKMVTHAPVVDEPLVAELVTFATMFVVPVILPAPLVLATCGQVPMVGSAMVVTGTMMVQVN